MPYYRGDYYRGDYYRGDFWTTLGHVGKGLVDVVTGNFGGAVSEGAQALGSAVGFPSSSGGPPAAPGTAIMPGGTRMPAPRGYTSGGPAPSEKGPGAPRVQAAGRPMKWNAKKGRWQIVRRINPLNVKALRRADRRARAFLRITHNVVRHYVPKQPKGRSYIRASKRRKR